MNLLRSKTRIALAVLAMTASAGASANFVGVNMVVTGIDGGLDNKLWTNVGGVLKPSLNPTVAQAQGALDDPAPGGNVELGKFGSGGWIEGRVNGKYIKLSGLELADWDTTGLDRRYIQGAAVANLGRSLDTKEMKDALDAFYKKSLGGGLYAPWQLVSDPNISYVYIDGHTVNIGLAGFLDAEDVLEELFKPIQLPPKNGYYQASEVVEVTLGSVHEYLFSFSATASGVYAMGCTVATQNCSYSGNYNVQIPEPESLALLGIGLVGLFLGRRRRV